MHMSQRASRSGKQQKRLIRRIACLSGRETRLPYGSGSGRARSVGMDAVRPPAEHQASFVLTYRWCRDKASDPDR